MNVQQLSRRAARAVIIGSAGLAIAAPTAGARPETDTPIAAPASGHQGTQPLAQTQGVAPNERPPELGSLATEENAANAAARPAPSVHQLGGLAMEQSAANAAARPAPAVQRHMSPAASDGSDWGTAALVGGGFAAMIALASLTVVLSRRNRLRAAS